MKKSTGLLILAGALAVLALVAVPDRHGYPEYTIQTHTTTNYVKEGRAESVVTTVSRRADGSLATVHGDLVDQKGNVVKAGGRFFTDHGKSAYVIEVPQVNSKMTFPAEPPGEFVRSSRSCKEQFTKEFTPGDAIQMYGLNVIPLRGTRVDEARKWRIETLLFVSPEHDCLPVGARETYADLDGEPFITVSKDLVSLDGHARPELFRDNPRLRERSPAEIDAEYTRKTGIRCTTCQLNTVHDLEARYRGRKNLN